MSGMKILIVEDEEKLRNSLKRGLEEQGFLVDVAQNGLEGKKMAFGNDYSVIVSDIIMPQATGMQMLCALRQNNVNTPILMLTALGMVEEKVQVYEAGADDYLTKPFDFRELLVRIKALIKRQPQKPEIQNCELKYAGISLNPLTKSVTRDGNNIFLTPKEFDLLHYFMQYPDKVITKNELLSNIWDLDFETNTNVLEVYINFLRNKIDKDYEDKVINTLPRIGYIFTNNATKS